MSAQEAEHVATVTHLPTTIPAPVEPPAVPVEHQPRITWTQVREAATPPDIWSDDRPSLRKLWLYVRYGKWTRATGFVRAAGTAYGLFSMAAHAVLYFLLWIVERPARFAVAMIVAALIKLTIF
jgi:hypothetical protein